MGQIVIRGIPDDVLEAFKERAKREGLATETLARQVLTREARQMSYAEAIERADRLRALSPGVADSSVPFVRALRDAGSDDPS